jgi:aconitase A
VADPTRRQVEVDAGGTTFAARVRLDTSREADYYRHGGVLPYVLRSLLGSRRIGGVHGRGWNPAAR